MTSKTLFFKLLKKDLGHRLWAVALIGLGCFFAYPVLAAMEASRIDTCSTLEEGLRFYNSAMQYMHSFGNGMTVFITMVSALVCGMSSFSYLNSRSKVDFYHSLPIRRELMYGANFISGILILAVPLTLSLVAAAFVAIGNGADGAALWPLVWSGLGLHLIYFILLYTAVVLAMIMTGNLVVAFLGYAVFCSVVPLTAIFSQGYFLIFFDSFMTESCQELVDNAIRISPMLEYLFAVENYDKGDPSQIIRLVGTVAVSGLLALLGCFLYRKRPSEAAGKAMAFEVTKPVIRIILVMLFSVGMCGFFWEIQETLGWAMFGAVCGAVIAHCVIEVIYHFDFKKLFAHPFQMIGCAAASVLILFTFYFDWFGYDTYLPDASKVEWASVDMTAFSGWVSYGGTERREDGSYVWERSSESEPFYNMEIQDVDAVLRLAEAGIRDNGAEPEAGEHFERVNIAYTLKNGKKVYRRYYMNLDENMELLQAVYKNDEFQKSMFPLMGRRADSVAEVGYRPGGNRKETRLDALTQEEMGQLLETYQEEFGNLTLEQMKQELPIGLIRFYSNLDLEGIDWWKQENARDFQDYPELRWYYAYEMNDKDFYPIYPSFKKTIALLNQQGIQVGDFYDQISVSDVCITQYKEDGSVKEIRVTEPEELEVLTDVLAIPGVAYYNPLLETENLDVTVTLSDAAADVEHQYSVTIPKGRAPAFVEKRLSEAEEWEK